MAIWATAATTGSAYQRQLITDFAASAQVTEVACAGLADAIDAGDGDATQAAVTAAAARTPAGCGAVVLGCTEYELAADLIGAALPGAALFGSAAAVAAQALRRAAAHQQLPGAAPHRAQAGRTGARPRPARQGMLRVLLSGRPAALPPAALRYPACAARRPRAGRAVRLTRTRTTARRQAGLTAPLAFVARLDLLGRHRRPCGRWRQPGFDRLGKQQRHGIARICRKGSLDGDVRERAVA